jgi:GNAT superfamily N-acetyltransferase
MNGPNPPELPDLGAHVALHPIGPDDWSSVRALHLSSFRNLVGGTLDTDITEAARVAFMMPEYTEDLMRENLWGAWLDGHLAGTCGWRPSDDSGLQARFTSLYIDPLFTRTGIGRRLILDAESRAAAAGFTSFTTRATLGSVGFFEACGYEVSSHGIYILGEQRDLPVTFMRKTLRPA